MNEKKLKTKKIVSLGVFSALSLVLYYLRFPLPMFPSFLEIQFSMLPLIIGGFCYGFGFSAIALVIKTIIAVAISFGNSIAVGEFADLTIGLVVLLVVATIYSKNKTKKTAIISLVTGVVTWVLISALMNYFILIPIYIKLYFKGDINSFIGAISIIPNVTTENYKIKYVLLGAIPFNTILSTIVSLITFVSYKKISRFLKKEPEDTNESLTNE
ncbi:MAG: hypothetical protein BHW12_01965 [Coprobacillus sp. 28_7]|nr:MAG: hypothetical protein BHW12_01965 [Coprobacillus sp. 28_7]